MNTENAPLYLPLEEAAEKYALAVGFLLQAIEEGLVQAARIEDVIVVADEDAAIIAAQVTGADADDDELVSINEAARRLGIQMRTVSRWQTYGWLPVIATGSRNAKLVSWQHTQAVAALYKSRSRRGSRLIPKDKDLLEYLS